MIGIHPNLRGQIKRYRKPSRPLRQQIFVALVRFVGVAHARVLPHGPQTPAIHRRLHAAREGILPRVANRIFDIGTSEIRWKVHRLHRNVRGGLYGKRRSRIYGLVFHRDPKPLLRKDEATSNRKRKHFIQHRQVKLIANQRQRVFRRLEYQAVHAQLARSFNIVQFVVQK